MYICTFFFVVVVAGKRCRQHDASKLAVIGSFVLLAFCLCMRVQKKYCDFQIIETFHQFTAVSVLVQVYY